MVSRQKGKPDSCGCRSSEGQVMPQSLLNPGWGGSKVPAQLLQWCRSPQHVTPCTEQCRPSTHALTDTHQGSLSPPPLSHTPLHMHTHCPVHPLLPRRAVSEKAEQFLWPSCAFQSRGVPVTILFKSLCENRGFEVYSLAVIQC